MGHSPKKGGEENIMFTGNSLVGLLIQLLIGGVIIYAVYLFLGMLNLPSQIRTIILLVVAVIALIFLAGLFGIQVG